MLGLAASHSGTIKLSLPVYSPEFSIVNPPPSSLQRKELRSLCSGKELVSSLFLWSSTMVLGILNIFILWAEEVFEEKEAVF